VLNTACVQVVGLTEKFWNDGTDPHGNPICNKEYIFLSL
jgi:hypothetical protein